MHAACSPTMFSMLILICKVNNGYKTEPQCFHFGKILLNCSKISFHGKKAIKWIKYGPGTLIIARQFFSSS